MGWTPAQVDQMTLWEFSACTEAFAAAHGGKSKSGGGDISEDRLHEMNIEGF